ncbi:hypothetical protein B0H21DRAFT_739437 [Amylocystis lapponica]|nr:hypothetical protein B0H21DRAFT_739437 [Amylocystis lapponica]
MVFVNSQKFACESCIKGHRSSSCHHTERPLFEIKKKGRPVSQCEKCRELRKTKRMHNKCNCTSSSSCNTSTFSYSELVGQASGDETCTSAKASGSTKSRRFRPIAPALPNGLKDMLSTQSTSTTIPPDPRAKLDTLLNPCHCKSVWQCRCRTVDTDGGIDLASTSTPEATRPIPSNGLVTLAQAAAFCCSQELSQGPEPSAHRIAIVSAGVPSSPSTSASEPHPRKHRREPLSGRTSPHPDPPQPKRPKHCAHSAACASHSAQPPHALELPPIQRPDRTTLPTAPVFPAIPPIAALTSAADGCTCDTHCACPGCTEHRGPEHASHDFNDCMDGCGTCIDNQNGSALPLSGAGAGEPNFIDAFFARAAALPPPPMLRRAQLDATDVTVYPSTLFTGAAREREERGVAFGLVTLPRLECGCAGGCGCPEGRCECGSECGGCCEDEVEEDELCAATSGALVSSDLVGSVAVAP